MRYVKSMHFFLLWHHYHICKSIWVFCFFYLASFLKVIHFFIDYLVPFWYKLLAILLNRLTVRINVK